MNSNLILRGRHAVVFGASGSIGAAVAKEFAAEAARVFLAGRTKASLETVAEQIRAAGGEAQTAVVDALDDSSVNRYLDDVAKQAGKSVRVVCLRTVANIDSRPIQETMEFVAARMNITKEQAIGQVALSNFLKVPATVKDTANAAVLIASDRARMMTGTVVNASAGAALD